ncbi:MAG: aspartate/glutamate racemase family protein [Clostridia bacterium]
MKFLIINPNMSKGITKSITEIVGWVKNSNSCVDVISNEIGFESLESFYEYEIATIGMVQIVKRLRKEDYEAILIACFGDPGLYALREISKIPVYGIAELTLSGCYGFAGKYALIVAKKKAEFMMEALINQYGLRERLSGIYSVGIPVSNLSADYDKTYSILKESVVKAIENGADTVILACAGFTPFAWRLKEELKVNIVDPVSLGYKMMEALTEIDIQPSKSGLYEYTEDKLPINFE